MMIKSMIIIMICGHHDHDHYHNYLNTLCIAKHEEQWQRIAVGVKRVFCVQRRVVDVRLLKPVNHFEGDDKSCNVAKVTGYKGGNFRVNSKKVNDKKYVNCDLAQVTWHLGSALG